MKTFSGYTDQQYNACLDELHEKQNNYYLLLIFSSKWPPLWYNMERSSVIWYLQPFNDDSACRELLVPTRQMQEILKWCWEWGENGKWLVGRKDLDVTVLVRTTTKIWMDVSVGNIIRKIWVDNNLLVLEITSVDLTGYLCSKYVHPSNKMRQNCCFHEAFKIRLWV